MNALTKIENLEHELCLLKREVKQQQDRDIVTKVFYCNNCNIATCVLTKILPRFDKSTPRSCIYGSNPAKWELISETVTTC